MLLYYTHHVFCKDKTMGVEALLEEVKEDVGDWGGGGGESDPH